MRSLLFVPADDPRKLAKAGGAGADALILDLEDSVALSGKARARRNALAFLREAGRQGPRLFVRVNGFSSGLLEGDIDAVLPGAPDGVVLPKAEGGADVQRLDALLSVAEALHDIEAGRTRVVAIATETARGVLALASHAEAGPRLAALAWGGEDLAADLGAAANRAGGAWTEPFRLARNLCLFAAKAAGVEAIDTVFTDFRNLEGLRAEAEEAARDGFTGKLAIHPAQVEVINAALTPSEEEVRRARAVVEAFGKAGDVGVVAVEGQMLDRPHLKAAEGVLARAGVS